MTTAVQDRPPQPLSAPQDAIGARYRDECRRLEKIQKRQRVLMEELWFVNEQERHARAEVDRLAAEHRAVERGMR